MSAGLLFRPDERSDQTAIRRILEEAFKGAAEADLVDRLRLDNDLALSLLAVDEEPIGYVAFSPLRLPNTPDIRACALAPLAVLPEFQSSGIGTGLVVEALRQLRETDCDLVLVLGEPAYYGRFGFAADVARGLNTPYDGPYVQALYLSPKAEQAQGTVVYASAFAGLS